MNPLECVVFDVHDVFYDTSHWQNWLKHSLARIGVDVSFFEFCSCAFNPFAIQVPDTFWDEFSRLLSDIGLNSGQICEFLHAAKNKYKALTDGAKAFNGVKQTITELLTSGMRVAVLSPWCDQQGLNDFVESMGICLDFTCIESISTSASQFEICQSMVGLSKSIDIPPDSLAFVSRNLTLLDAAAAAKLVPVALAISTNLQPDHWLNVDRLSQLNCFLQQRRRSAA
jgi:hypothetical protein